MSRDRTWLHPSAHAGKARTPECPFANLYQASLPSAESHCLGGPAEPPGWVTRGGPSPGAAVGAGATRRPHPGIAEGAGREDPGARPGGAGAESIPDPPPRTAGGSGRGRRPSGQSLCLWAYFSRSHLRSYFSQRWREPPNPASSFMGKQTANNATCESVSTSGTAEGNPGSKRSVWVSARRVHETRNRKMELTQRVCGELGVTLALVGPCHTLAVDRVTTLAVPGDRCASDVSGAVLAEAQGREAASPAGGRWRWLSPRSRMSVPFRSPEGSSRVVAPSLPGPRARGSHENLEPGDLRQS